MSAQDFQRHRGARREIGTYDHQLDLLASLAVRLAPDRSQQMKKLAPNLV
jgi:hypothetical protein